MPYKTAEEKRAYAAKYRQAKKDKLKKHLSSKCCIDCGEDDWIVLEFDHRVGVEKKFEIGRAVTSSTMSWASVVVEMEKCDIVCSNCHRRRSYSRQNSYRSNASVG